MLGVFWVLSRSGFYKRDFVDEKLIINNTECQIEINKCDCMIDQSPRGSVYSKYSELHVCLCGEFNMLL